MSDILKRNYEAVTLSATAVEQSYFFPQTVSKIHLRNSGSTNVIIAFITDAELNANTSTTTVGKQFVLVNAQSWEDELGVRGVKYRTASGTSTVEMIGSW